MGYESKQLASIDYVTDTDVSYYHNGEIVNCPFEDIRLEAYLGEVGFEERAVELREHLCRMVTQLENKVYDLRQRQQASENDSVAVGDGHVG